MTDIQLLTGTITDSGLNRSNRVFYRDGPSAFSFVDTSPPQNLSLPALFDLRSIDASPNREAILAHGVDPDQNQTARLYDFDSAQWTPISTTSNHSVTGELVISDVNDAGILVGNSNGSPFVFRIDRGPEFGLTDVNSLVPVGERSQWTILSADAVNNTGTIAGTALHLGQLVSYLLKPDRDLNQDGQIDASEKEYFGEKMV